MEIFVMLFINSDNRLYGTYCRELIYAVKAIKLLPYCTGAVNPAG